MNNKLAFLDQEPPPGYVAGVGRGAVGFSTVKTNQNKSSQTDDVDDDAESNNNQELNEGGLLLSQWKRDEEDEEADLIFEEIENRLKSRRKHTTMVKVPTDEEVSQKSQFSDLKRDLTSLTEDEWLSLPEAGDMTRKNKRSRILEQQSQRLYTAPDSILAKRADIGANGDRSREEKENLLSSKLDNLVANKRRDESDPLEDTILSSSGADRDAKFADLKKGRLILSSLRKTEPYRPSSWIQSARLEEQAKSFNKARDLISQACKTIPGSEEVWIENVRLNMNDIDYAKAITKEGLKYCKNSVNLWMKAIELEMETKSKKRKIMQALEEFPRNDSLWKLLIDIEDDKDVVQKLLIKAVDLCPTVWEFWIALVNISTYDDAKKYLNKARKTLSGDVKVWIAACKLEERENPNILETKIRKLTDRAVNENPNVSKSEWFDIAINATEEGFTKTGKEIVSSFLRSQDISPNELVHEAEAQAKDGHFVIVHCVIDFLVHLGSAEVNVWQTIIGIAKQFMDTETLLQYYSKAITINPDSIVLYLMYAKDASRIASDVAKAREILHLADSRFNDDSIKFASIKLEFNSGHIDRAKSFVEKVIKEEPKRNVRYWYKYIHILRCAGVSPEKTVQASRQALDLFPGHWKLHLQHIQILMDDMKDIKSAREAAALSVKKCPQSTKLWIAYSMIEEKLGVLIKARSILDTAALTISNSVEIAVAHVELEKRQKNTKTAINLTNKNLKQFPTNTYVWYQHLSLIPKMSLRKPEFVNALSKTNNSPEILLYLGILFWQDGKFAKAKSWFDRSLSADPSNGDAWVWLYTYWMRHGNAENKSAFLNDFKANFDDITKGNTFKEVQKDPKTYSISHEEILQSVSRKLLKL
ncbi:prp1 [Candida margitis]|uniref:prp1 n=1 Tax=Candida margitis TaxID=1775924 RepID=UPI0022277993|nr:prp1 [Candida margitis]KAI5970867.1 prp1 [Candida margitis]